MRATLIFTVLFEVSVGLCLLLDMRPDPSRRFPGLKTRTQPRGPSLRQGIWDELVVAGERARQARRVGRLPVLARQDKELAVTALRLGAREALQGTRWSE